MRRVDRELGRGVWEEPIWSDWPKRNPRLSTLLTWHELRIDFDLLDLFPHVTRKWALENGIGLDLYLKCVYADKRIKEIYYGESPFLALIPRR